MLATTVVRGMIVDIFAANKSRRFSRSRGVRHPTCPRSLSRHCGGEAGEGRAMGGVAADGRDDRLASSGVGAPRRKASRSRVLTRASSSSSGEWLTRMACGAPSGYAASSLSSASPFPNARSRNTCATRDLPAPSAVNLGSPVAAITRFGPAIAYKPTTSGFDQSSRSSSST